ncbi:glutamate racemase [Blastomonas sp.]|uniref:glutamate racemase n=1 Tax=Blastomonas sp. TaxID=1909299 RepID=UPI003593A651
MTIAADAPLLFFDSGIGGLTVMDAARALLPDAPIVYAADFAGLPYGEKTEAEIAARVPALLGRLVERYRPRLITIACNTASTIALPQIRAALDLPVVGTVPAIKPASEVSQTRVIGVLGTEATVRQPYVDNLAREFADDATIIRFGARELVRAAEMKMRGQTPDPAIFARAIAGLVDQQRGVPIDTIVLACTHFPIVQDELAAAMGRPVTFVDGAAGIARRIAWLTRGQVFAGNGLRFVATGPAADVIPYRPALTQRGFSSFDSL